MGITTTRQWSVCLKVTLILIESKVKSVQYFDGTSVRSQRRECEGPHCVSSLVNWLYLPISVYLPTTFVISARLLSMSLSPLLYHGNLLTTGLNYTGLESEHPNLYSSAIFTALKYSTICSSFNKSPACTGNSSRLQPDNTIPRMSLKTTSVPPDASLLSCQNELCDVPSQVRVSPSLLLSVLLLIVSIFE